MTQIFADGFESGDFSAWTGTSGLPTVQNTTKHHGTYGCTFDAPECTYKTFSAMQTVYFRAYVRFNAIDPTNKLEPLALYGSGGSITIRTALAGIKNTGKWYMEWRNNGWVNATDTEGPTAGVWYCLELYIKISTTGNADGEQKLYINGIERLSASNIDNDDRGQIVGAMVGELTESTVRTQYIDCVVVSDAYIGPEVSSVLQTVTDSLSLNDALLRHKIFAVSESIGAVDVIAGRNKSPLLTFDSISLVDLACTGKQLIITDAMRINDFSSLPSRILKALDSIGISDDFTIQKTIIVNDNVSLVELAEAGVGAGGTKKTRLFLILGDLAIQLSGD